MKSIEFIYWLQGSFEMGNVSSFDENQVSLIKKHLKMVEILEAKQQLPFCFWLRGVLESQEKEVLDVRVTEIIKNKLNSIFEHVVSQTSSSPNLTQQQNESASVTVRC